MKKKIINAVGCLIARWIIGSYEDGLIVKRKAGAEQIIKVFSVPAYRNVIKPRLTRTEPEIMENVTIGTRGKCRCGGIVHGYQRFCPDCGAMLSWRKAEDKKEERMIQIEDRTGKKGALCEGVRFSAEDKLRRTYEYRFEGIENTENGCGIHLHNLTNGTETYVEKEWFRQRKISIL